MAENINFSVNQSKVVFERFDEEIVLINLENGNYFSIREVACSIWELIEQGHQKDVILAGIAETYKMKIGDIEKDVQEFIDQLIKEGLIESQNSDSPQDSKFVNSLNGKINPKENIYTKPILEIYSDMQDLILLDPIHEVDETGWPNVKNEPGNPDDEKSKT